MNPERAIIVGAGISGLLSAYYLIRAGYEVEIVEKENVPGGLIQTVSTQWGLVETAANAIINSPKLEELAREIQVAFCSTRPESRKRFIFRNKPRQWPLSPLETTEMALRFARARPRKPLAFETMTVWGRRVLGEKGTAYLVEPGLQGIYAGRPSQMSATLILSRFFNKPKVKKEKPMLRGSVAPAGGMGDLISGLTNYLREHGVKFTFGQDYSIRSTSSIQVVCTSVFAAGKLLMEVAPELSVALRTVPVLPLVSFTGFFPFSEKEGLVGFGCLFPRDQKFRSLGVLMNHNIFDGRTPHQSETWILGGAGDPEIINLSDREILDIVLEDKKHLLRSKLKASPLGFRIQRWPQALPHYTTELEHLLENQAPNIRALEKNGIYLMGNYLGSIGLSQVLEMASGIPERISKDRK